MAAAAIAGTPAAIKADFMIMLATALPIMLPKLPLGMPAVSPGRSPSGGAVIVISPRSATSLGPDGPGAGPAGAAGAVTLISPRSATVSELGPTLAPPTSPPTSPGAEELPVDAAASLAPIPPIPVAADASLTPESLALESPADASPPASKCMTGHLIFGSGSPPFLYRDTMSFFISVVFLL